MNVQITHTAHVTLLCLHLPTLSVKKLLETGPKLQGRHVGQRSIALIFIMPEEKKKQNKIPVLMEHWREAGPLRTRWSLFLGCPSPSEHTEFKLTQRWGQEACRESLLLPCACGTPADFSSYRHLDFRTVLSLIGIRQPGQGTYG